MRDLWLCLLYMGDVHWVWGMVFNLQRPIKSFQCISTSQGIFNGD